MRSPDPVGERGSTRIRCAPPRQTRRSRTGVAHENPRRRTLLQQMRNFWSTGIAKNACMALPVLSRRVRLVSQCTAASRFRRLGWHHKCCDLGMSTEHSQVVVGFDFSHSGALRPRAGDRVAIRAPWHVLRFVGVVDPHFAFPALPTSESTSTTPSACRRAQRDRRAQRARRAPGRRTHPFLRARADRQAAAEIMASPRTLVRI